MRVAAAREAPSQREHSANVSERTPCILPHLGAALSARDVGASFEWGAQLLAQTASKIGHHAQPVGHRPGNFVAVERQLRLQEQAGDGGLQLGLNGRRSGSARHRLLPLAAMQRGANLADQPRRSGDGKVDLQRNGQAGRARRSFPRRPDRTRLESRPPPRPKTPGGAMRSARPCGPAATSTSIPSCVPTTSAQLRAPSIPVTIRMLMLVSQLSSASSLSVLSRSSSQLSVVSFWPVCSLIRSGDR